MNTFAYVFERFPSFTQTFCLREVMEMDRQGMNPMIFSIRSSKDATELAIPEELRARIHSLPKDAELTTAVRQLREERKISSKIWEQFQAWGDKGDKTRLYEAAWIGVRLKEAGVRHVHTHFAGIAARTAYWIKEFFGIGFSFTGHANDIFCETDFPVSLEDLVRESRFVATVSDFSRKWLGEKFPAHAEKIHRVYNGIEVGKFAVAGHKEGRAKILSVGRYIEKKGFSDLIEACRQLKERRYRFECRIVGGGPLEEALKGQVDAAGLGDQVFLTGPRTEPEVIQMLGEADLFVLPCVGEVGGGMDNLPTVIMEAMAAGLPVVSTPVAGVPEMVLEGETGLLVPEHDPALLVEAIKKLLGDPDLAQGFGRRGAELAAERFASPVTTRQLKNLLVGRGGARLSWEAFSQEPGLLLRRLGL